MNAICNAAIQYFLSYEEVEISFLNVTSFMFNYNVLCFLFYNSMYVVQYYLYAISHTLKAFMFFCSIRIFVTFPLLIIII